MPQTGRSSQRSKIKSVLPLRSPHPRCETPCRHRRINIAIDHFDLGEKILAERFADERVNAESAADERHGSRLQTFEQRIGETRELAAGSAKDGLGLRIAALGRDPYHAGELTDLAAISAIDECPNHVPVGPAQRAATGMCRELWTSHVPGFPPRRAGQP